jgi:hypothetical protein
MIRSILYTILVVLALQSSPVAAQEEEMTPTSTPTQAATATVTATPTPTATPAYPGVVTGTVFHDRDLDGVKDDGEEGLEGWEIDVYPRDIYNGGGLAESAADGAYRIEGLDDSLPNWELDIFWPFEVPITRFYGVELPQPTLFSFKHNLVQMDIAVAYDDNSHVTFHVWEDFDGDGAISAADELALWTDVAIKTPSGTAVFDASGPVTSLTLRGLLPGDYVARATTDPLNEVPFSIDEAGNPQGPVELLSKPQITFYGYVYEDGNKNGVRDAGEPGLAGAEIEVETHNEDGTGSGVGRFTEPDGSYVLADVALPQDIKLYVGCTAPIPLFDPHEQDNTRPEGYWRRTVGTTPSHHGLNFQDAPVVITTGVYRYHVDCGLVYEIPQPVVVSPPVSGGDIALPPAGTGSGGGSGVNWPALALAGVGALLIVGTKRAKWKRPDPNGASPLHLSRDRR